jgi:hypothetical protein
VPTVTRVHGLGAAKLPAAGVEKVTEPAGAVAPTPLMSETVAVHEIGWLIATEAGVHDTLVEVVRLFTVSDIVAKPVPALLVAVTLTVNAPDNA